jgi:hypothetical protein
MLVRSIIAATAIVFATSAFAQGVSNKTPGHQMQDDAKKGTKSAGPGASEYAPGHKMQKAKKSAAKSTAPGASEYAPGQTTGSNTKKKY